MLEHTVDTHPIVEQVYAAALFLRDNKPEQLERFKQMLDFSCENDLKEIFESNISFPKINREETQKRLEHIFESVRLWRQVGAIRQETSVAISYGDFYHAEDIWTIDSEKRLQQLSEVLEKALLRLSELERELITKRYFQTEDVFDYEVIADMQISERKFYRIKSNALFKLSFMLRQEVLEQQE